MLARVQGTDEVKGMWGGLSNIVYKLCHWFFFCHHFWAVDLTDKCPGPSVVIGDFLRSSWSDGSSQAIFLPFSFTNPKFSIKLCIALIYPIYPRIFLLCFAFTFSFTSKACSVPLLRWKRMLYLNPCITSLMTLPTFYFVLYSIWLDLFFYP